MNECLLCKRDMEVSDDTFGDGCIRNLYKFLNMDMPKKVSLREEVLHKNIMKLNHIHHATNNQKLWLTDRYLTYQYLIILSEKDLYFAINNAELYIIAKKEENNWKLNVKIHDRYDYNKFKTLDLYYKDTKSVLKSLFSSTLYNLAYYSVKFGVIKEYNIDVVFKVNSNFEVIKN